MATEKITFKLPAGFNPQTHLKALEALIAERHGDGFDIDFIDPDAGFATASRHVAITSVSHTTERSSLREVRLPKDTKASDGEKVAAKMADEYPDYAMITFDPHLKRATLALMDAVTRRARDAVSVALGVNPWDVGITPRPDGGYDLELPRTYVPSKHDAKLDEVAVAVVGREGWYVEANAQTLRASIIPADPPTFPATIAYPFRGGNGKLVLANDQWARVPLGITLAKVGDESGHELLVDFSTTPHGLFSGTTGSGKLLRLNTRVPVPVSARFPNGWATVETLQVHDDVYAADGTVTEIIGFSDIAEQDVYKVQFDSGQSVECGPDHLWTAATYLGRYNDTPNQLGKHKKVRLRVDARVAHLTLLAHAADPGAFATSQIIAELSGLSHSHVWKVITKRGLPCEMVVTDAGHVRSVNRYDLESVLRCAEVSRRSVLRSILNVENPFESLPHWITARELLTSCGVANPSRAQTRTIKEALLRLGAEMKIATEHVPALCSVATFPVGEALLALAGQASITPGTSRARSPLEKVMSTIEMFETQKCLGGRPNWSVKVGQSIQGEDVELPLDPYVLGIWLGDGTTSGGQLTQGTTDKCTDENGLTDQRFMLDQLGLAGIDANQAATVSKKIYTRGLTTKLRAAGVLRNKHIPAVYLRASREQRLALLQGLMDTDGTIDTLGSCELCLCDETLVYDSLELIRSLGIKASISSGVASLTEIDPDNPRQKRRRVTGTRWRIHFTTTQPIFRLPRKAARVKDETRRTQDWLYVTNITKSAPTEMRCLRIAHPSHLVVVDQFVPTHNSVVMGSLLSGALFNGFDVAVVDGVKGGVDYVDFQPYVRTSGWGDDLNSACCVIAMVYEEGVRRKHLIKSHNVQKWTQLPAKELVRPILLIVDELTSLISPEAMPKGVSKDNPLVAEIALRNLIKATILNNVGKIARELRFAGISLVCATQVASTVTGIPTELRTNLGAKLLLGVNPTDNNRRLALNDPDAVPEVPKNIKTSSDGASKGVAVFEFEGQESGVVKTYFAEPTQYAKWLDSLGVEKTRFPRPSSAEIASYTPSLDDDSGGGEFDLRKLPPTLDPVTGDELHGFAKANEQRRLLNGTSASTASERLDPGDF